MPGIALASVPRARCGRICEGGIYNHDISPILARRVKRPTVQRTVSMPYRAQLAQTVSADRPAYWLARRFQFAVPAAHRLLLAQRKCLKSPLVRGHLQTKCESEAHLAIVDETMSKYLGTVW